MIPDGSPLGAGSPSHAAATAAALTSERFAGLIILITGARNVTDYAAAHKGRPQVTSTGDYYDNTVCRRLFTKVPRLHFV